MKLNAIKKVLHKNNYTVRYKYTGMEWQECEDTVILI